MYLSACQHLSGAVATSLLSSVGRKPSRTGSQASLWALRTYVQYSFLTLWYSSKQMRPSLWACLALANGFLCCLNSSSVHRSDRALHVLPAVYAARAWDGHSPVTQFKPVFTCGFELLLVRVKPIKIPILRPLRLFLIHDCVKWSPLKHNHFMVRCSSQ